MACTSPCFDCPFSKFADKDILILSNFFDFWFKHMTEDGGTIEFQCEEQDDTCFGQIQVLSNAGISLADPFSELAEIVEATPRNTEDFWGHRWEMAAYYDP